MRSGNWDEDGVGVDVVVVVAAAGVDASRYWVMIN